MFGEIALKICLAWKLWKEQLVTLPRRKQSVNGKNMRNKTFKIGNTVSAQLQVFVVGFVAKVKFEAAHMFVSMVRSQLTTWTRPSTFLDFGKIFGFSIPIAIWTMAPLASSWHSKSWQTGPGEAPLQFRSPTFQDLKSAVQRAKGSPGPDGWHAEEIRNLPQVCLEVYFLCVCRWQSTGTLPVQLQEARQVSLPKAHKRSSNGTIEVKNLRPITVMSSFWRIWAAMWLQSAALQTWRQQYIPACVAGAKGGLGAEDLAARLQTSFAARNQFLVSLDYSQCYDAMHPEITASMLRELGFPAELWSLLRLGWGHQWRWLQWERHTHDQGLLAQQATPQGCPLAPFILGLWMTAGWQKVEQDMRDNGFPSTTSCIYMDDCSFLCPTLAAADAQVAYWNHWSQSVGLRENQQKIQAKAKGRTQRAALAQAHPEWFKEEVHILGCSTTSTGRRKNTQQEIDRLKKAKARAFLIDCARPNFANLVGHTHRLVVPLCSYGWISKKPTKDDSDSSFKKLTSATHSCRMANENIRKICYGAAVHLDVVWATRMFRAVIRLRQSGCAWQNKAATCVGLLRRWLVNNGWAEVGPWSWHNGRERLCAEVSQQQPVALALHNIRQQWRRQQFILWLRGKRHEAHFLLAQYSEQQLLGFFDGVDWEATRLALLHGSAAERSVILGAVVSPLWLHRSGKEYESGHCPWCDDVSGHWMHLAWYYCNSMSPAGPVPTNPLLARFGWQLHGRQQYSVSCLHWLGQVQQELWLARFGQAN